MNLTHDDIQEILRLLDASPYDELQLETERFKLTLRRGTEGQWTQSGEVVSRPNLIKADAASSATPAPAADRSAPEVAPAGLIEVRTPLPGTFYRAPQPGAPPFVEVDSRVQEDTVVCIIETMKLMNTIHAGARGRIAEICLENAQFTEKDSVLMRIAPDGP